MLTMNFSVNIPLTLAVVVCELVSLVWYRYRQDQDDRYLLTALACDIGLAFVIHYILKHYWVFSGWLDGIRMGLTVGLLYFCLQAPHHVYGPKSLMNFTLQSLHKSLLVMVISCTLFYGRKMRWPFTRKKKE